MRVFAIVSLLLLVPAQSAWAQSSERTVYVSVLDKKEAPATGLTASDFIVREDDIAREVLRASHATQPAQIALLIDTSQAIEEQITDIRTALRDFVKQMAGKHEISLVGFGERPMMIVDYTRDVARLEKGIGTIFAKSGSGTYILDAIVDEARKLQKRKAVRPHLIVYAARGPEFSERHSQGVVDVLRETGVTFHALPLNRPGIGVRDREEQELQMTLANGTQQTGGRREDLLTPMSFSQRLLSLGTEIDNQYAVVYARPQKLIPPKTLEISVKRPELTARARRWP